MIYCVFVGPFKDSRLGELAAEYEKRLTRLWPVTVLELKENPRDILKFIESKKDRAALVSLDAHGERLDSLEFTRKVTQSSQDIHFFGWGASGPPPEAAAFFTKSVSLSPMTFSHEMARVLLMEQLYRAGATLKGHPYPK
ncbi:MAG TPA: 23S rRNA (pseudouridine(1915)-N(3))-methyltransferase RlmH [bacterium]|nr:23S rRNA (pseudouridine(1915)-N(3))-methyltransferase RlmH [bacterium]